MRDEDDRHHVVEHHGFGILDSIERSFPSRLIAVLNRLLAPVAVLGALYGFLIDLGDRREARDAEAWQVVTTKASGNSGKIQALEYLNKDNPLAVPNPRHWGIPLGPVARKGEAEPPAYWFVLFRDFGSWRKKRTPLVGIDLSRPRNEKGEWTGESTYLENVQLQNAILERANLAGADLFGADLSGADLGGADLSHTNLVRARLVRAVLISANLSGANLLRANLAGAQLVNVDLTSAELRDANLSGALLANPKLDHADLAGTNLSNIEGLSQAQIDQACTDGRTILPAGLKHPAPCKRDNFNNIIRDHDGMPSRDDAPASPGAKASSPPARAEKRNS